MVYTVTISSVFSVLCHFWEFPDDKHLTKSVLTPPDHPAARTPFYKKTLCGDVMDDSKTVTKIFVNFISFHLISDTRTHTLQDIKVSRILAPDLFATSG